EIIQKEGEPLRTYLERFNRAVVEVKTDDRMKLYLLDQGLRRGSDFAKAVGIEEIKALDAFLKSQDEAGPSRRGGDKRKEEKIRESKPPPSKFTGY
ncbi:hypothetical protein A2U01_0075468, partial [Trifolium medium]|nr:hypothetical protein [Trifolium medium]